MTPAFPLPDPDDAVTGPFWTNAAQGRLTLPWCERCGRHVWYPREACPACSGSLSWIDVALTGTVAAATVVHHAFLPAYADLVPFVAGLVEIDGTDGCRLATRFLDAPLDGVPVGAVVRAEFVTMTYSGVDGSVTAPMFRAV